MQELKDKTTDVILFKPLPFTGKDGTHSMRKLGGPYILSLLAIAGPLLKAGYNVKIIDQEVHRNWQKELYIYLQKRPICIGITAMTGVQIFLGLEVSTFVRCNSNIPIVWGGIHPTLLPEQTIKNEYIDFVVEGEGEETFLELVRALQEKADIENIKGIWYKENGRIIKNPPRGFIDLNKQPFLPYQFVAEYKKIKSIQVFTSRGCPYKCAYCYNTTVFSRTWRALTVEETLKRVKFLAGRYRKRFPYLFVVDDNFFVDKERARAIIEGFTKFDFHWSTSARVDTLFSLDDAFIRLLEKSRCALIRIGIESGSERILNLIKKDIDISQLLSFNKRIAGYNIRPSYNFMIGFPTETLEDIKDTIGLFSRMVAENKKAIKNLNVYTPYPGTELFNLARKYGFHPPDNLADWSRFYLKNINTPWIDLERKKLIEMLLFCSIFLDKERFLNPVRYNAIFHVLSFLYRPLAKLRISRQYYKFPFEIKLGRKLGYVG